jgi:hypothetical protein
LRGGGVQDYKQARVPDAGVTLPAVFGGLLLMMGNRSRSESLFYYFRLEDQVPENHLLRLIDRHINFDFVRAKLLPALNRFATSMDKSSVIM